MSNIATIKKSIIATISYFDIFEYPLTAVEIWKWLYQADQQTTLGAVITQLASGTVGHVVEHKDGFYFLKNREALIWTRLSRYKLAEKKFSIALRAARALRSLPFVQMIGVCNNVGYNNATPQSDIDFFIIASPGRIWLTRLLVTTVMNLLRLRRHGRYATDRVCLSFYVTASNLNLSTIALVPNDPYLTYWFTTLVPLYDRANTYQTFLNANGWLKKNVVNFFPTTTSQRHAVLTTRRSEAIKTFGQRLLGGSLGDSLERLAAQIQARRIKRYFGSAAQRTNTNVVIDQSMLKFHKTDRRAEYRQLFEKKLHTVLTQL